MTVERSVLGGLATLLVLAFFLPWMVAAVMVVPLAANGFGIKDLLLSGMAIRMAFSPFSLTSLLPLLWTPVLFLLYFIPLLAAVLALLAFSGSALGRTLRLCSMGLGIFVAVLCSTVVGCAPFAFGDHGVSSLSIGFWLTLLGGLGLIGAAAALPSTAVTKPLLTSTRQAELQAHGRQVMTHAADWLTKRKADLNAGIELRRIQYALGRRVNRTILDAQDTVVVPAGTLITNELIARARQEGVLSTLLDSVEADTAASIPPEALVTVHPAVLGMT
ncbi:hypothetical protein MF271_00710 (plasmid) [Deinococcus sp. KNUC1210]|uniref:hypothetical protein n=1 Tax=Deinococcus sp. KNUC1210 TaxID=2917691 RepID=UPI001EF13960|nr:hypothetical protein [Deinococcus sp. KNUC1210]ULH14033.1 hypothetical protein MF271_00710 [Deinococcus sp. KNUC1210]